MKNPGVGARSPILRRLDLLSRLKRVKTQARKSDGGPEKLRKQSSSRARAQTLRRPLPIRDRCPIHCSAGGLGRDGDLDHFLSS